MSQKMQRCATRDELYASAAVKVPAFCITHSVETGAAKRIFFTCPGTRGGVCTVPFSPTRNSVGATWNFDGNEDAPTLTPSIDCKECWHGFITNGEITS